MENENKCRTCDHSWEEHSHCGRKICCHGEINFAGYINATCECNTGWIPRDNLEFLEMKYDRSKLAIKSSIKSNEDMPTQ